MATTDALPIVFTAQSKLQFFCRDAVCEFVLQQKCIPLNPFRVFEYFLHDRVDRDLVRTGNNNLIRISDELWVFGPIPDGVIFEIRYASDLRKPIRFFSISARASEIKPIELDQLRFETDAYGGKSKDELIAEIAMRVGRTPAEQFSLF